MSEDDSKSTEGNWVVEGTAHVSGLQQLPDRVLDMHETERYAVFSDGETLLLKPADQVKP